MCVQGLGVRNFPEASYDVESIYQQESIDSLFASIKAEASALSSAQFTSRYLLLYIEHLEGTFRQPCHVPTSLRIASHIWVGHTVMARMLLCCVESAHGQVTRSGIKQCVGCRYTGVYHGSKGTYDAYMPVSNHRLGRYVDETEAAMAYDQFCI